jgi:hypothetical protein
MDNKLPVNESVKILVSLVEIAQRRGTYTLDESYLAFNAIHTFTKEKKYDDVYNYINEKLSSKDSTVN